MTVRNILHKKQLESLTRYLQDEGYTLLPVKGYYEVLRMEKDSQKIIVYEGKSPEHLSVQDKDISIIKGFFKSKRQSFRQVADAIANKEEV
ncbi:hypothetical protein [Listeria ivanovii]|uniref:hypothetical protein n=1 Tax=Listeria ivanovii TaxID=1638 RepID=UPI00194151B5|nr:hypothetical protein [Listeria ivanovii]MBM5707776.1 hypothetical protein [Listeria ivanovii]